MTDDRQPPQKAVDAERHVAAGIEQHKKGNLEAARTSYRAALRSDRSNPDAFHMLGVVTHQLGDTKKAISFVEKSLSVRPDFPPALLNLTKFFVSAEMYDAALESAERLLSINPDHLDVLAPMAAAQRGRGEPEAALETYRTLSRARPKDTGALHSIGVCLMDLGRLDEACDVYRDATEIAPDNANLAYHFAVALNTASRFEDALAVMEKTLSRAPDDVPALITAGESLQSLGRMDEALQHFERAVALAPEHAEAHFNLGLALLTQGDYLRGWEEYAWRTKTAAYKDYRPPLSSPFWQGEDVSGKTLLAFPEQGMGDSINFIRYASVVHDMGARVICVCPKPLQRLFAAFDGVDEVLTPGEELDVPDYQISMMELPRVLKADRESIPLADGYLKAPDTGFVPEGTVSVGIVWQGNLVLKNDANRSVPLSMFESLSAIDGVQLYSLQVGPGEEQIDGIGWNERLIALGPDFKDYADTAAAISKLDLVIAVDTSVAHLAGALGKPVWLLLPANADWRWGRSGERTPWYTSMRLFRQPALKRWDAVFAALESELRTRAADAAR